MVKLQLRENMKTIARFFGLLLCAAPFWAADAVVSTTAGNNLTAYNGNAGAMNNNRWNTLMNSRTGGTTATADFGNCNALIMRCAQPKCSNGGCTDLSVTSAIVSGCVNSNASCKQYGDDLIEYISAQLVAQSTAKANEAANAAQTAAANAAAQQSAQQMQQMQQQMQQMQSQMAAQNAQQLAQLQSALDEQKQLTENALAQAAAAQQSVTVAQPVATTSVSDSQVTAAQNGVSADVLAREQITGQIMSSIENAEVQLKALKATMTDVFEYAGCDSRGNNCTGPKRVKMFKQKAEEFFDPYESVLDELYDALILAQSVGVDISDIYMLLNGTCNAWAQYLCLDNQVMHYTSKNCINGKSVDTETTYMNMGEELGFMPMGEKPTGLRGGASCVVGQVVPMSDGGCQLVKMLTSSEEVQRNWLYPEDGDDAHVRVGCASEALDNSALFRNRKKQATIDIETLRRMIAQDAPQSFGNSRYSPSKADPDGIKWCNMGGKDQFVELQKAVNTKSLPASGVCVPSKNLESILTKVGKSDKTTLCLTRKTQLETVTCAAHKENKVIKYGAPNYDSVDECLCRSGSSDAEWKDGKCVCVGEYSEWNSNWYMCDNYKELADDCEDIYHGKWNQKTHRCDDATMIGTESDMLLNSTTKERDRCW